MKNKKKLNQGSSTEKERIMEQGSGPKMYFHSKAHKKKQTRKTGNTSQRQERFFRHNHTKVCTTNHTSNCIMKNKSVPFISFCSPVWLSMYMYSTASNGQEAFYFSQDFISWVAEENKGAEREKKNQTWMGHGRLRAQD